MKEMTMDYKPDQGTPLTRIDLLEHNRQAPERQAQAWDRLRRVVRELDLVPPTFAALKAQEQELFTQKHGDNYEEMTSLVQCSNRDGSKQALVNFHVGYSL
jgi:hypothetical protein